MFNSPADREKINRHYKCHSTGKVSKAGLSARLADCKKTANSEKKWGSSCRGSVQGRPERGLKSRLFFLPLISIIFRI